MGPKRHIMGPMLEPEVVKRMANRALKAFERSCAVAEERNALARDMVDALCGVLKAHQESMEALAAKAEPVPETEVQKTQRSMSNWASMHWAEEPDQAIRLEECLFAVEALASEDPMGEHGISHEEARRIMGRHEVPRSVWKR